MKSFVILVLVCITTITYGQNNWILSDSGIPADYSPNDFAISPSGSVYLVASQINHATSTFVPKLLKSVDQGSTWSEIAMTGLSNVQNTNAIIFSGGNLLLAGSNSSTATYYVYSSADSGANWTLSDAGIPAGYSPNDFAISPGGTVYLVASQYSSGTTTFLPKLLKSMDHGNTWSEIITSGLTNVQNTNAIIFSGGKLLLGGSNSTTASYYVYSSADSGANWTISDSGIPSGYSPNDFTTTSSSDVYLASCQIVGGAFSPRLLKSSDNGNTWHEITGLTGLGSLQNTNCITETNNTLLLGGSNSATSSYYVFSSSLPVSGVPDEYLENTDLVFPNPFKSELIISCPKTQGLDATVTNCLGQLVIEEKIMENKIILNTSDLPCGLYFVTISGDGLKKTFQVCKQ